MRPQPAATGGRSPQSDESRIFTRRTHGATGRWRRRHVALSPPGARSSCAPPRTSPHPPPPTQACIIPARGRSRCVTVRCADPTARVRVASRPQRRAGGSRGPGEAPAVCAQLTLFLPPLHMWFLRGLYKTSPGHPPGAAPGWSWGGRWVPAATQLREAVQPRPCPAHVQPGARGGGPRGFCVLGSQGPRAQECCWA